MPNIPAIEKLFTHYISYSTVTVFISLFQNPFQIMLNFPLTVLILSSKLHYLFAFDSLCTILLLHGIVLLHPPLPFIQSHLSTLDNFFSQRKGMSHHMFR